MSVTSRATIIGHPRRDGGFGLRNLVLVVSLIDLANDVAIRVANETSGAVALLTPAGGLSFGEEARLIDRLRWRLCRNPNVAGVVVIGQLPPAEDVLQGIVESGRAVEVVALLREADTRSAVDRAVRAARGMLADMAGRRGQERDLSALRLGLRSSSSSLDSALRVNPLVGSLVDIVADAGGAVAFGELADLAGVAEELAGRGASPDAAQAIRRAMEMPRRQLLALAAEAPDPTPTNQHGGIANIEMKGQGALRRLGAGPVAGVFPFGAAMPDAGLWMMDGPGSAAVCLVGLAAAGCNLVAYTVGATSSTATLPLAPVVKVGPPALRGSRDLDWCAQGEDAAERAVFLDHVREIASGRTTAGETVEARQIMLPSHLPPL